MYIVYEAFDDNTAIILDIPSFQKVEVSEKDLIKFSKENDVLGLSSNGKKINYINAYNCMTFPSENEADEYIKDNGLSYQNKRYIQGYWFIFERKDYKIHVDYYVCYWLGDTPTFVGQNRTYTPYIQAAKVFTKKEAQEKAALMTIRSKTGKFYSTYRKVTNRRA